jgi:carboxymethylenebutenolidase
LCYRIRIDRCVGDPWVIGHQSRFIHLPMIPCKTGPGGLPACEARGLGEKNPTKGRTMRCPLAHPGFSARCLFRCVLFVFWAPAILLGCASEAPGPHYEIFSPAGGKGAVVVVASGYSGPGLYRAFASKLAALGYCTVLMDGKDLIDPGSMGRIVPGAGNLRTVIDRAQSSPLAMPGKVALVGFSMGGAGVLAHGAGLKDQVYGVVAFYPALATTGWNMTTFATRLQTPVLLLAGERDNYEGCCWIETMHRLAEAPHEAPFELVVYPEAGHCFNIEGIPIFDYRPEDAADAWARTVAFLARWHPPGKP